MRKAESVAIFNIMTNVSSETEKHVLLGNDLTFCAPATYVHVISCAKMFEGRFR